MHLSILLASSIVLRIGSSVKEGAPRNLDLELVLCREGRHRAERRDCQKQAMLDIHRMDSSFLVNSKHGLEGILDFVVGTDSLEEASIDIAQ